MDADHFDPPTGVAEYVGPALRRILAPNPSPMTYRGTNTYLLGKNDIAVIDPGPMSDDHMMALLDAVEPDQKITHIFVTHSHLDHSPMAADLSQETGAPVLAYGPSGSGRSEIMQELASAGLEEAGEGIDLEFSPDIHLRDGETVATTDWSLTALWTPGHLGNHLCFAGESEVFTGDLVMGWASSLVSPPDGDLTDFMTSCRRLRNQSATVFHAGHGAPIQNPTARLDWLINHRNAREAAILEALELAPATTEMLARLIYTETPEALMPAARRNILAHLIDLFGKKKVIPMGGLSQNAEFKRI